MVGLLKIVHSRPLLGFRRFSHRCQQASIQSSRHTWRLGSEALGTEDGVLIVMVVSKNRD